jgi:hypothetical protein
MREVGMRGSYALARVTAVRAATARALLWTGAVGAPVSLALPVLPLRETRAAELGAGLLVLGVLLGALHRRRWYATKTSQAERAPFAVTLEPPELTRRRLARANVWRIWVGMGLAIVSGLAAGPALGMFVFGLGLGVLIATALQARRERRTETLTWSRTEDGRLLGRRTKIGAFATTGPAAGKVRPVVRPAGARG